MQIYEGNVEGDHVQQRPITKSKGGHGRCNKDIL